MAQIRISIDGKWTAVEFSTLFGDMEFLAKLAMLKGFEDEEALKFLNTHRFSNFDRQYDWDGYRGYGLVDGIRRLPPVLIVGSVRFESPGWSDLLGAGKVVRELRLFLTDIIDRFMKREDRAIERDIQRQELLARKLANAAKLIEVARKAGMDDGARTELMHRVVAIDNFIEGQIAQQKITDVRSTGEE
jgi:hypothetical protein